MKNTVKVIALLCLSGLNLAQATHKSGRNEEARKAIAGHIEVGGVRLQYLDWGGSGEGLLFVPGGCDTAYVFGDVAPAFTDRFHVVSFTPRGCGRSDHPDNGYELDALIEEMAGFLDVIGIAQATLVGHSSGGGKITRFAQLRPSRVSRLIYLDTVFGYVAPGLVEALDAAIAKRVGGKQTDSWEMMRRSAQLWELGAWSKAWERNIRETVNINADGSLKYLGSGARLKAFSADMEAGRYVDTHISHPALMIFAKNLDRERAGQFDVATRAALKPLVEETERKRQEQIRAFGANGAHIKIVEMPRTGHYCFVHKPRKVIRAMREFLESTRGTGASPARPREK